LQSSIQNHRIAYPMARASPRGKNEPHCFSLFSAGPPSFFQRTFKYIKCCISHIKHNKQILDGSFLPQSQAKIPRWESLIEARKGHKFS
jgi:hypothetical protein